MRTRVQQHNASVGRRLQIGHESFQVKTARIGIKIAVFAHFQTRVSEDGNVIAPRRVRNEDRQLAVGIARSETVQKLARNA